MSEETQAKMARMAAAAAWGLGNHVPYIRRLILVEASGGLFVDC